MEIFGSASKQDSSGLKPSKTHQNFQLILWFKNKYFCGAFSG
jgi:hypothetical protein